MRNAHNILQIYRSRSCYFQYKLTADLQIPKTTFSEHHEPCNWTTERPNPVPRPLASSPSTRSMLWGVSHVGLRRHRSQDHNRLCARQTPYQHCKHRDGPPRRPARYTFKSYLFIMHQPFPQNSGKNPDVTNIMKTILCFLQTSVKHNYKHSTFWSRSSPK
jgi:hypothetical protein